jgi:hypothetical protein
MDITLLKVFGFSNHCMQQRRRRIRCNAMDFIRFRMPERIHGNSKEEKNAIKP